MIPFNRPPIVGSEIDVISAALEGDKLSGGGGPFSRKCEEWFENTLGCCKALLTPSGTASLEMAAMLLDIHVGDEVIMPSYTFVSTANAFALRGATIVFVDIRPDTMNIDELLIEEAITNRTKAIVVVHYAGVSCEMDVISSIAKRFDIAVVEDAAQGVLASYKDQPLGSIGTIAAFSFHETKNLTSGGEGGLTILNNEKIVQRAEIIREKGTNRSQYFRGQVDKYSWVDIGSSYLMNEISAAFLWAQIEQSQQIFERRMQLYERYKEAFSPLASQGSIDMQVIPECASHNAHMFYIKVKNRSERTQFIDYLMSQGICATFHYVPLHSSEAGQKFGRFCGNDKYTTRESDRLVRLPLFFNLKDHEQKLIIDRALSYFL